jgi:hypothetical protein
MVVRGGDLGLKLGPKMKFLKAVSKLSAGAPVAVEAAPPSFAAPPAVAALSPEALSPELQTVKIFDFSLVVNLNADITTTPPSST